MSVGYVASTEYNWSFMKSMPRTSNVLFDQKMSPVKVEQATSCPRQTCNTTIRDEETREKRPNTHAWEDPQQKPPTLGDMCRDIISKICFFVCLGSGSSEFRLPEERVSPMRDTQLLLTVTAREGPSNSNGFVPPMLANSSIMMQRGQVRL